MGHLWEWFDVELKPFDPADYLDTEEAIEAYLADAGQDGSASLSRALNVVARARARMAGGRDGSLESKAVLPYFPAMSTLSVTAKGQVTLRKDVLKHLGVRPGDKIDVDMLPNGRIEVRAARSGGRFSDLSGMLYRENGPVLTIEEINEEIAKGWAGER